MNHPTPIKHGDWRVINGQLVDFSQLPATSEPETAAPPKPAPVRSASRNRKKR